MGYYPVFLNVTGRPCVVIGGGPVAERKVEGLLEAGARVTVIAPVLTERLDAWARGGSVRPVAREYRPGDLDGQQLAFVATDDPGASAAVASEGRERGVWVNAADDPARCDFILPALVRRDPLIVAVSSGGASPALTRAIREELEAYLTEDYAALARLAADVRRELRRRGQTATGEAWRRALDADLRRLVTEGRHAEARSRLLERLRAPVCG